MATGQFTHLELPADDVERAKRFWGAVAGWEFGEMDAFPGYFLFRTGEQQGGALGRRGVSIGPVMRLYVTVDSLETACAAVEANGGTVVEQPTDIGGGMGRFAVIRDTEGTEMGLWQSSPAG